MKRRSVLSLLGGAGLQWSALSLGNAAAPASASTSTAASDPAKAQRVLIIGAAWAGLSAARTLKREAPELDILVIDRDPIMRSLPLSNPWLVDRTPERIPPLDRSALARKLGYRFVAAEVERIDRAQRQVHTAQGRFDYDWLVLASGIAYDYRAWFGDDLQATQAAQSLYPAGFVASELDLLKQRLATFRGGDLVMTVPAPHLRCPPAPYERAMMLAWWLKTQRIQGKLTLLDAGGGLPRFTRLFAERYPDQIDFRPYSTVRTVDPFKRSVLTDDGDYRFDHALLLPPLRASALVEQAGLLERDGQGKASGWAGVDPLRLYSPVDDHIYLAGDLLGAVSPLFGHYPKTAHMATRLGAAAALQIAARSRGQAAPAPTLGQSICHVWLDADPPEQLRIDAQYRLRGDGVIAQAVNQHDNPQPRGEDVQWARTLQSEWLGATLQ